MVNLFHRHENSIRIATLTERMLLHIGITNPFPRSSVSTVYSRISVILLVVLVIELCVFFTETVFCQLRASRIVTWMFWLAWHSKHLLPYILRNKKSPTGFLP
jgi:hypothetical protein